MLTTRFVSCAAVALCALSVAAPLAHATSLVKYRDWEPINAGLLQNPNADGMAMLRYNAQQDLTEITMVLHGLLPNTEYGIFVLGNTDFSTWFTTSSNGSIMFQNQDPWGGDHTDGSHEIFIFSGNDPWDFDSHVLLSAPYIK